MNNIKVMVVDDEILIAKNIAKNINELNPAFEVIAIAENGEDALTMIAQNQPKVVFSDIKMPVIDGLQLTKIIKEKYPSIRTVIVSGYNDFHLAKTAMANATFDYLLKPVNFDELADVLTRLQHEISAESASLSELSSLSTSDIVENIKIYIKHNYDKAISFGEIASKFGFSQAYLSKIFKDIENISPLRFLNEYRTNLAKELLIISDLPIKVIAEKVGFPDPYHFSKLFKDIVGTSPQTFRDENEL